jgi:hypothetical protein
VVADPGCREGAWASNAEQHHQQIRNEAAEDRAMNDGGCRVDQAEETTASFLVKCGFAVLTAAVAIGFVAALI